MFNPIRLVNSNMTGEIVSSLPTYISCRINRIEPLGL